MRQVKRIVVMFLAVCSIFVALLSASSPASAIYLPLTAADGKPVIVAHVVRIESGTVELALQVLAPGKTVTAVRIDNLGGVSSLWRSDAEGGAAPISVSQDGVSHNSGTTPMVFALGNAEVLLSLRFKDNGAFYGKSTDFRVTVFFKGGERALCELSKKQIAQLNNRALDVQASAPTIQEPIATVLPSTNFKRWIFMGSIICIVIIAIFVAAVIFSRKRLLNKAYSGDAHAQFLVIASIAGSGRVAQRIR